MVRKADTPETESSPPLEDQIAQLRADLAGLATALAGLAQTRGAETLNSLGAEADKLRAEIDPKLQEARNFVQGRPFTALGYALGAGVILGLLFGRR